MWSTTLDPDHRLVADALEADWNDKLRALRIAQETYERQRQSDRHALDEAQKAAIRALAQDFPRLWNDPHTPHRERKRLVQQLIEDVTLLKAEQLQVAIRFKGGKTDTLTLPRPKKSWQLRQTEPHVVATIDQLLEDYTDRQIAEQLNTQGLRSGWNRPFHVRTVARLRKAYDLKNRYERLRARGLLTQEEIAQRLDIHVATVKVWRRQGLLKGHAYTDRGDYLYEYPGDNPPVKHRWKTPKNNLLNQQPTPRTVEV